MYAILQNTGLGKPFKVISYVIFDRLQPVCILAVSRTVSELQLYAILNDLENCFLSHAAVHLVAQEIVVILVS